ncbi:protein SON-like [Physella acuta]|uniref:protein SON-like n=1 Tax=Physella acuta TaxID=109671 RepID=UPI0027DE9242|nr:protein SON-like [Physella acuta]XP_059149541.1 protein SON-like [Physella acuta]XP_059149542.1 protein SON-like [Physella acuta]
MIEPDLTSIPLPMETTDIKNVEIKKTAKEMLQEALKDHKSAGESSSDPKKVKSFTSIEARTHNENDGSSSQSIVDELFKDFISKKIGGGSNKDGTERKRNTNNKGSVDDEISKLLDMEISSIKCNTRDPSQVPEKHPSPDINSSLNEKESLEDNVSPLKAADVFEKTSNKESTTKSASLTNVSQSSPAASEMSKTLAMVPHSVTKRIGAPKQLMMKLSSESLTLIKSTDRIDRNGKLREEGEVYSSHSDKSDRSESDLDDLPSETGSISSDTTGIHSHRSKKKSKHKKKKKKSSKSRDKEHRHKHKKSKDGDSGRSDDDGDKRSDKAGYGSDSKKEKYSRSRSSEKKEYESDGKRKHSRSRSRSPKKRKKSRSYSRSPKHHGSYGRKHFGEWDARHYGDRKSPGRDRSRSPNKRRSRSRERERSHERNERDLRLQIDKAKLRKIAIANALQNMRSGQGPRVDLTAVKSGGKSVEELTEFCKKISAKGKDKPEVELSDSSDDNLMPSTEEDDQLIHHPFKVRELNTASIKMNIRNAKQLPVLTPVEKQAQQAALRLTFPVSSGSHHRASESEWVPVVKPTPPAPPATAPASSQSPAAPPPPPAEPPKPESIFPNPVEAQKIDIGTIISERLQAVRKLQENPYDVQALTKMHKVQEQASMWATSKHLPGQFTGSTGAHVLSQQELIGDKRHQAWAKKTQLTQAAPVNGGIGMFLLQKMGWKQGEGLGKNNEGSKEPLMLDIKIDRKGLTAAAESNKVKTVTAGVPRAKDLSNKHPVSALMELCNRRRWGAPVFTVVEESGPDHKKSFLFKVKVNNVEYQPSVSSTNKKTAKAQCAAVCLQEMGLLPRDAPLNV